MAAKRELVGLMARLPASLHKRLEAAARANDQSLNSELIHRLEQSFGREGRLMISRGDVSEPVRVDGNALYLEVGDDSPQDTVVLKITQKAEAFKEHFGVKK